jgi:F-type H+-transporting ATPase subunit delta
MLNFLKVVARKGRADCLQPIARAARRMLDESAGRLQAVMTTAHPVDDATKRKVAERFGRVLGKEISLDSRIDPAILGGLVVRVGDTVYDGSLRSQLDRVRRDTVDRVSQQIRQSLERFASQT